MAYLEARNSILIFISSLNLNASIKTFENFLNFNNIFLNLSDPINYTTSYSIDPSNITLLILLSILNSTKINSIYIYKKETFLDFLPEVNRVNRDRDNKNSYF